MGCARPGSLRAPAAAASLFWWHNRPMSTIRLISIDLDGTLLGPDHTVSAANYAAVRACVERGVRVLLASGRSFRSMRPHGMALDLPQLIALNGAVIGDTLSNTTHARHLLTREQIDFVSAMMQSKALPFCVFGVHEIYCLPGAADPEALVAYGEPVMRVVPAFTPEYVPDPIKVLAFCEQEWDAELAVATAPVVSQIRSHRFFLEWLPAGVSKGHALAELMNELALDRDEVLSIGDGANDISMFAASGISVAMGGAPDEVVAAARYTTESNLADGVALALRRFVLDPHK